MVGQIAQDVIDLKSLDIALEAKEIAKEAKTGVLMHENECVLRYKITQDSHEVMMGMLKEIKANQASMYGRWWTLATGTIFLLLSIVAFLIVDKFFK